MIKMYVKSVCVGVGPIPSAVVLQPVDAEHEENNEVKLTITSTQDSENLESTPNVLPISLGMADAASICAAAEKNCPTERPVAHKLLANVIEALGATLVSVSIDRVDGQTFYAALNIQTSDGALHHIDARPSDVIAVALFENVDILVSEDLLEQAGSPDYEAIERQERKRQAIEFHDFVENLSPEDFVAHRDN